MADLKITADYSELTSLVETADKAKASIGQLGTANQKAAAASKGNVKVSNDLGVAIQQTGYQVGDFVVQVQSGTNAFVAFGQQATQLVGVLPLIAGRIGLTTMAAISLSTGLGIAIPIVTAIGAAMMRTSGDARTLEDKIGDLESAVESYSKALESSRNAAASIQEDFGVTSALLTSLVKDFEAFARIKAIDEIGNSVESLRSEHLQGFKSDLEYIKNLLGLKGAFAAGGQEVREFDNLLIGLEDRSKELGVRLKSAVALRDILLENSGGIESMTNAQETFYNDLILIIQQMEIFNKKIESSASGQQIHVDIMKQIANRQIEVNQAREDYRKIVQDETKSLQDQISLYEVQLHFGLKSQNSKRLEAQFARDAYQQELLQAGVRGNHLKDLMAMYDEMVLLKQETEDVRDKTEEFAEIMRTADLSHLVDQSKTLADNMSMAADAAAAALAMRTLDVANARNIQYAGRGTTSSRPAFQMDEQGRVTTVRSILAEQERNRRPGRGGGGGGGGKDPAQAAAEYLQKLQQEAEFKLQLVGLSEQEQRGMEIKKQYLETLEQDNRKLTDAEQERIDAILKSEEALKRATEAEQRREAIQNSISSNVENALMAVVDGTQTVEEAFKSMIRNILLEIYRQMVAKPIATGIADLFAANGAVLSGGNVVPFAKGGVVGGPTFFPMSGGKTGLMGEAGPEAIMPLKRGPNGKLGVEGGGNVTVQQTFNFAANGDESVKRLIAEAAPKIANLTQKQILDSRRRGGTMKATFG